MTSALDVDRLSVRLRSGASHALVDDVSCSLPTLQTTILIGESGSGKTTLTRALTRLLGHPEWFSIAGSVRFEGRDLLTERVRGLRQIRRTRIRYVHQEPNQSLDPLQQVGVQLRDAAPSDWDRDDLRNVLERAGLDDPDRVLRAYPHELSTGMLQRVTIAMAIAPNPAIMIADEPTSAIDPPVRRLILEMIRSVQASLACTLLLVTHDPEVLEHAADQVLVLFRGRLVEISTERPFRTSARHPYARQLMRMEPAVDPSGRSAPARGCVFQHRCPRVQERCRREEPELERATEGSMVRCFFWK